MDKLFRKSINLTIGAALLSSVLPAGAEVGDIKWRTIVDNNYSPPGINTEKFFSYNQPSINNNGLAVFRARAKKPSGSQGGGGGEPTRGIFTRNMALIDKNPINTLASTKPPYDVVPYPNNITRPKPAVFNEFPAFPRIDKNSNTIAFRAQSQPTWSDPVLGKLGGTSGVYANPYNVLRTGARNLEVDAGFNYFLVPAVALSPTSPPTRFDQFPGAPAISEINRVTFKGNYNENSVSKTGIFSRANIGGRDGTRAIAWSGMAMPGKDGLPTLPKFGSTAPPSTADKQVVFAGFDNEEKPTAGGIFHALLGLQPSRLKALLTIGDPVPLVPGAKFTRFGEALSFDGRYIGFWGAWGTGRLDPIKGGIGWKPVILKCPKDGNKDVIKACIDQDKNGTANDGEYTLYEPRNQGIFVYDISTKSLRMVARTNGFHRFNDFLSWSFTGAPPGVGGGDEGSTDDREPPRWRSSAFAAVSNRNVAFKAKKISSNGIYLRHSSGLLSTVLDSTMTGNILDGKTIIVVKSKDGAVTKVPLSQLNITTLGLERDGYRSNRIAVSVGMADQTATYSWAGIYLGQIEQ